MIQKVTLGLVAAAIAAATFGCGNANDGYKPDPNAGLSAQQRADQEVKDIQNNPNMPDSAKQTAIATIQAHAKK